MIMASPAVDCLPDQQTEIPANRWESRRHVRYESHQLITLRLPNDPLAEAPFSPGECQVRALTVSAGGASFVFPVEIPSQELMVGLDSPCGTTRWFHAELVHSRKAPTEDHWIFGVAFRGNSLL